MLNDILWAADIWVVGHATARRLRDTEGAIYSDFAFEMDQQPRLTAVADWLPPNSSASPLILVASEEGAIFQASQGTLKRGSFDAGVALRGLANCDRLASVPSFYAVGDNGSIFHSPDGENWTQEESNTDSDLFSVSCPIPGLVYVVGAHGTILRRTTSGWEGEESCVYEDLFDVNAYIGNHVNAFVAVGAGGTILETTARR